MRVTVHDQNGSSFAASTVEQGVEQAESYAEPGDVYRVYVIDRDNPYPGYIAAWVSCDSAGVVTQLEGDSVKWDRIWRHFNRMQRRVMATKTSRLEFFAQPEDERMAFYEWLQQQCGGYSCYM